MAQASVLILLLAGSVTSAQTGPLSSGYIYTYAGNGVQGFSGDGGPATSAELGQPSGVTLDAAGNLYIADNSNNRVRKVDAVSGIISTVAGNGTAGNSGDGGPATSAELYGPTGIVSDAAGNFYFSVTADGNGNNSFVRKVAASTGIVTAVAGGGSPLPGIGDGGPATSAYLQFPEGLALDAKDNLYIADCYNNRIRKVDAVTGIITTVAGTGSSGFSGDGGPATSATLTEPSGIVFDAAGDLYIADWGNFRVRKVDASTGIITTVAGDGTPGNSGDGGPATSAEFFYPYGVALDSSENLYISDQNVFYGYGNEYSSSVRRVDAKTETILTSAGGGSGVCTGSGAPGDGELAVDVCLYYPSGVVLDASGNLYIAEAGNNRISIVRRNALPATTTTLTAAPPTLDVGQSLTLTATVTPASGSIPAGTVTFYSGIVSLGYAPLNSGGSAVLTLTPGAGNYSITASYGGSSTDAPSQSSPPVLVTVAGMATTTSITASATSLTVGQTLTLTATVNASSGTPSGTVTFSNGTTSLGSGNLNSSGVATLNTSSLPLGTDSITAVYSGDANFAASTSSAILITVTSYSLAEWTWMSGSSTVPAYQEGQPGIYGTLGTPAAGNVPGGREWPASWTDNSGHLWLFGGNGFDANGNGGFLNDLWEFNPSLGSYGEWAWMSGSRTGGQSGVYGKLGTPAAGNMIGGRNSAVSWTDSSGHFWLFGGTGFDADGVFGNLNDLWVYNPSLGPHGEWIWMGGGSTVPGYMEGQPGVYGKLGTPAAGNIPGGRQWASSWIDSSGHLWLFGGNGDDAHGNAGYLNDLWEFNPSLGTYGEWAWMGGSSTVGSSGALPGVYGTLGTPAAGNIPGNRENAVSWTDSSGHLWLFGGFGYDSNGEFGSLNDLWEFNPSLGSYGEWTWMGGSSTVPGYQEGQPGVYGTPGTPAAGNIPGGRGDGTGWNDSSGNFWLFGGNGVDVNGNGGLLNDLWEFNPSLGSYGEWAWMDGSSTTVNAPGVYGKLGTPAATNIPGGRYGAISWTDSNGNSWLFGGGGQDANNNWGHLNDLWTYQPLPSPPAAATPTFSPPAGTYTAAQTVTISDTTPGAVIYFTTNGTAPNTNSSAYSVPVTVSSSETIEAIATASGDANSPIATAAYTITLPGIATTTSLTASAISLPFGDILTLTATVNAASGDTPTGTVTFFNGQISLGSGLLNSSGVATLAITPAIGSYSIIANYGGSTTDGASSSSAVPVTVTSASNSPDIYTFAGDGALGYNGDGELATSAELNGSVQMAMDTAGNVYLADSSNHRIRKVFASTGTITTVAGNGTSGYTGDGGPAIDAQLMNPYGVAVDAAGNIYISDTETFTIRKVDAATGTISTIVGNGIQYNGPVICGGGLAIDVEILSPGAITLDNAGNIYFVLGSVICKVEAATGIISRIAGNVADGSGFSGDGGPATSALLSNNNLALAFDTSGNLYIADTDNQRVRRVDAVTGIITTVAGNGGGGPDGGCSGDGGPATNAELSDPAGVALDAAGNLYVSTVYTWRVTDGSRVRRVDAVTGIITTYAGNGNMGFSGDGGPANLAELSGPSGLMMDAKNNLYIADANANNRIRIVGQKPVYSGAATTTTLTASADPAAFGSTVTFTATVAGSVNALTGTVSFYDGTTLLATEALVSEAATYATSTLSIGSHNIAAVYSGEGGFNGSTSNLVVESIVPIDFSISASPASQTVYTGEAASYTVTIAPGIGFNWTVALSCTQLPANSSCAFSPATVSGGAWSSTLVVQTTAPSPATSSSVLSPKLRVTALAGLFLLVIPRRLRRYRKGLPLLLVIFAALAAATALAGCSTPGQLSGATPLGPQTIAVTGIATSGSQTLTHSANVTLNVKSLF